VERNPIKGGSECEENGGIKHEERFLGPEREESGVEQLQRNGASYTD
jgi:hypothetical protein